PRVGLGLPRVHANHQRERAAGSREARRGRNQGPEHPDRVGRRLPARAGGERELSLRFRLLAAAAGIVATSLLLSGALTWFLVRNVELQAAQDSVDRNVQVSAMLVRHQECLMRTGVATNAAAGELVPRLLVAGGAALLVALILVLIVSRSVTKPLTQLAGAAEDIAGGNYSRRVGIRGPDEIGHLGVAFDRMAEAVERAR